MVSFQNVSMRSSLAFDFLDVFEGLAPLSAFANGRALQALETDISKDRRLLGIRPQEENATSRVHESP